LTARRPRCPADSERHGAGTHLTPLTMNKPSAAPRPSSSLFESEFIRIAGSTALDKQTHAVADRFARLDNRDQKRVLDQLRAHLRPDEPAPRAGGVGLRVQILLGVFIAADIGFAATSDHAGGVLLWSVFALFFALLVKRNEVKSAHHSRVSREGEFSELVSQCGAEGVNSARKVLLRWHEQCPTKSYRLDDELRERAAREKRDAAEARRARERLDVGANAQRV